MSSYLLRNSPQCRKLMSISPLTKSCMYQQRSIFITNFIVTLRVRAGPARLPVERRHSPRRLLGTLGAADQSYSEMTVPSCFDKESLWVTLQKPPQGTKLWQEVVAPLLNPHISPVARGMQLPLYLCKRLQLQDTQITGKTPWPCTPTCYILCAIHTAVCTPGHLGVVVCILHSQLCLSAAWKFLPHKSWFRSTRTDGIHAKAVRLLQNF